MKGSVQMKLTVGETYEVEVVKVLKYGAIVKMSDGSTQLLHISGKVKPEELSIKNYTKDFNPYAKKQ